MVRFPYFEISLQQKLVTQLKKEQDPEKRRKLQSLNVRLVSFLSLICHIDGDIAGT